MSFFFVLIYHCMCIWASHALRIIRFSLGNVAYLLHFSSLLNLDESPIFSSFFLSFFFFACCCCCCPPSFLLWFYSIKLDSINLFLHFLLYSPTYKTKELILANHWIDTTISSDSSFCLSCTLNNHLTLNFRLSFLSRHLKCNKLIFS